MITFICFISLLAGILLANKNLFSLVLILMPLYFTIKRKYKVGKYVAIFFTLGFIISIIELLSFESNNIIGVVIKSSSNYSIVKSIYGSFYVKIKNLEVGDIVKINGFRTDLSFSHYQESFNFKKYLLSFGVSKEYVVKESNIIFHNFIRVNSFKQKVMSLVNDNSKKIIESFIFGTNIDEFDYVSKSGLLFIFRISGLNIVCIIKILDLIFKDKKIKTNLTIKLLIIIVFVFLSNYKIAFIRLLISQIIRIVSKNKFKKISIDSLTGIILLLLNANVYRQMGFYMVFPLLFLLNFSNFIFNKFSNLIKNLLRLILIYLYFLPFNIINSYSYFPFLFILRLIAIPIAQVGFIVSILSFLPLGEMFYPILNFIINILNFLDKNMLSIPIGDINHIYYLIYYILLLSILYFIEISNKKFVKNMSVIFLIFLSIPIIPINIPKYEVHFIDVDQGDSTLIRYKDKNYLIDTGGLTYVDLAKKCLIPYFTKLKITKIDKVYITHLDFDHYGALDSLVSNFKVGEVLYNEGDEFIKDINKFKDSNKDTNYNSSVFNFTIKNKNFLIMGDAPKEIENKIMSSINSNINVLKVGHHGSDTSSDYKFLSYVKPDLAVISCGLNNKYKHPSSSVINNLDSLNIKYVRLDLLGTYVYKC